MTAPDSVLLLGFGGPTPGCCERREHCSREAGCEAECFVSKILGDDPRQAKRLAEVTAHYHHFGGFSPYNERTELQRAALEHELGLPVAVGYRNWKPWYQDGWQDLRDRGCSATLEVVLAPHQGKRSWDDYLDESHAAWQLVENAPRILGNTDPLFQNSQFIDAILAQIHHSLGDWDAADCGLLLTAHAIPQPAERGAYRRQVEITGDLVAARAGFADYKLGFQSGPDESRIPWSQPTVDQCVADFAAAGRTKIIVCPIGFLVDHMEVLFDLDTELQAQASDAGIAMRRASTVEHHPLFIQAIADQVRNFVPN